MVFMGLKKKNHCKTCTFHSWGKHDEHEFVESICQQVGSLNQVTAAQVSMLSNMTSKNSIANHSWDAEDLMNMGEVTMRVG